MPQHRSGLFDVAVLGAGVIGLTVAWRAAQRGLRVAVLDRAQPGAETSHVAAGMLAPTTEASPAEQPVLALGLASAASYPDFVAELREASGLDPGYRRSGTLVVARDGDEAETLGRELEVRRGLGLEVRAIRASEARRLEPALAPVLRGALEIAADHSIDPRALIRALAGALQSAGGELRAGAEVAAVRSSPEGHVSGLRLKGGEEIPAGQVVIAAGPWSGQVGGIPRDAYVPLHPVKGQIIRLHDPAGAGLVHRVLRMADGYIVPRGDGRYVLGATAEERGFDRSITAGAGFELLREAIELVPGFTELAIDEFSVGFRPATPDNLPAIGPGVLSGLHWATGHYRHGILLAPVTGEIMAAVLTGEEPSSLAESVTPLRFAGAPAGV